MNNISNYDQIFYGTAFVLLVVYWLTLWLNQRVSKDALFTFRNITVSYFIFFSVLLAKFNYDGTALSTTSFNYHLWHLLLFYTVVVLAIASMFNLLSLNKRIFKYHTSRNINLVTYFLIILKILVYFIDPTPLQNALAGDFESAVILQSELHSGAATTASMIYRVLSPLMVSIFLLKAMRCKRLVGKLFFLALAVETSGWYFSKYFLAVPLIIFLILKRTSLIKSIVAIGLIVIIVFVIRLNINPFQKKVFPLVTTKIALRLMTETAYSNIHLELYEVKDPPLFYEASYYLGFNTLFGIKPRVDVSRDAYTIEKGKYGATTSGSAIVFLYGFWGNYVYVITPLVIILLFYFDLFIYKQIRTDFEYVSYLVISFYLIKVLSSNLNYVISFGHMLSPSFIFIVLPILAVSFFSRQGRTILTGIFPQKGKIE